MESSEEEFWAWIVFRPPEIRALFEKWRGHTVFETERGRMHLVGFTEGDPEPQALVTMLDPTEDYDAAIAASFNVCLGHLGEPPNDTDG